MAVKLKTTEASETWRAILTAYTRVSALLEHEMADATGVTLDTYGILLMLTQSQDGTLRPSELANNVGLSRSATTRLVDRLAKDGLVDRAECPTDRRGSLVSLTKKGEETFKRAGRVHLRGLDEHVGSHLSATDMAEIRSTLTKLADTVGGEALALVDSD
jgi:DNA-binding MarR family transcriptional regulator